MKIQTCDVCKKEAEECDNYIEINHTFGYSSEYDGLTISLDICESCFSLIFKEQL